MSHLNDGWFPGNSFFFNVHKLHSQSLSVFCSVKTNILKLINVTLE